MATYRNRHTRQEAADDGELGLAHIDGWELVDDAPAADGEVVEASAPAAKPSARKAAAHK